MKGSGASSSASAASASPSVTLIPPHTFELLHRLGVFLHADVALLTKVS